MVVDEANIIVRVVLMSVTCYFAQCQCNAGC